MAQKIVTLCDVHARTDEDVAAAGWTVTLHPPGGKATTWAIDLCEDDGKTLTDLATMLDDVGRRTAGPRPKAARPGARGMRAPGQQPTPLEPAEDGTFPCPVDGCGKPTVSKKALQTHVRHNHDMTLAEALGLPLPYACPECGRRFSHSTGMGMHRRSHRRAAEASPAAE